MTYTEQEIRCIINRQARGCHHDAPLKEEDYAKTLGDLDMDSIDIVELAVILEDTFGIEISFELEEKLQDLSASELAVLVEDLRTSGSKALRATSQAK